MQPISRASFGEQGKHTKYASLLLRVCDNPLSWDTPDRPLLDDNGRDLIIDLDYGSSGQVSCIGCGLNRERSDLVYSFIVKPVDFYQGRERMVDVNDNPNNALMVCKDCSAKSGEVALTADAYDALIEKRISKLSTYRPNAILELSNLYKDVLIKAEAILLASHLRRLPDYDAWLNDQAIAGIVKRIGIHRRSVGRMSNMVKEWEASSLLVQWKLIDHHVKGNGLGPWFEEAEHSIRTGIARQKACLIM